MKINKGKTYKANGQFSDRDLFAMKEFCKHILKANIALKTLNYQFAPNKEAEEMCKSSIENSKKGLEKLASVENAESINNIILNIGNKDWATFTLVLGVFSGSLNDKNFYTFDKMISDTKREKKGEA